MVLASLFWKIASITRQQAKALPSKNSDDSQKDLHGEKLKHSNIIAIIDYWLNAMKERDQIELLSSVFDVVESNLRPLMASDEDDALLRIYMERVMALLRQNPKHGLDYESNRDNILIAALNNPMGKFAELVMQYQILTSPQYSDGLLLITKRFFEEILSIKQSDISHYGLCVIARKLAYLFSYDKEWTTKKLIPCFSWDNTTKARVAWSGYLWHAYWTPDLIKRLNNDFLATIDHIDDVDKDCKDAFAHLIGSLALYETDILSVADIHKCVGKFNEDLRRALLEKVKSNLETVEKNDRGTFWKNRIEPFFKKIWPNEAGKLDGRMSYTFGEIILMEGNAFPYAVERLAHHWAEAIKKSPDDYLIYNFRFVLEDLKNREHAKNHPQATVDLLYKILGEEVALDKEQRDIWEKHILVHLEPLNDKRLEIIKKKLK